MSIIDCTSTVVSEETSECGHAVNERLRAIADSLGSLDTLTSDVDEYINLLAGTGICHQ
jgi:hypothetical protein